MATLDTSRPIILGEQWYAEVPRNTRLPIVASLLVIAFVFLGFGTWAAFAPLAGAVVATGSFVATGQNKIVQHLEGGVIEEILVREGDVVEAGDILMKLDDTAATANLIRLQTRKSRLQAVQARLTQEANGSEHPLWPQDLLDKRSEEKVAAIILNQTLTFRARHRKLQSEVDVLQRSIDALRERISGATAQMAAVDSQSALYNEELEAKRSILKKGLIKKSDILGIERALANLKGERGRLLAEIGDSEERIRRAEAQIAKTKNEAAQTAVDELQVVNAELDDVTEQIRAAHNVLERIEIVAPVRGAVVRMRYHTPGGVVESGKDLMEILPLQAELVIEATINPSDIDSVRTGQSALVRLSALNQRVTPMIPASVSYVSADALPDDTRAIDGRNVYVARVSLNKEQMPKGVHFEAMPGMPAEVYITTRDRTFFDYLTEPLRDSMSRAFREP
ncbi:HlyD family type I secretion periplasmic adaptor subunit [Rhodobacteraceae bacterium RKSG542]|uniref:HlyD family type I secretion periplasmic adaptor subunit n=1 Tax=Pseudovibrio flavus TaxID=2529854 RepID=UPI0012BC17D2|nr:HlyD family type I secretion periplasmic adaptor subunit [Pseudovibrio flavus]MTI17992.1 HlyD family type I secretion periplasmic adaptor subunit [Pseudovibrio flavus]